MPNDVDDLDETVDILRDEPLMQRLDRARREIADGSVAFDRPDIASPSGPGRPRAT